MQLVCTYEPILPHQRIVIRCLRYILTDSKASEPKPEGMGPYLRNLFEGTE